CSGARKGISLLDAWKTQSLGRSPLGQLSKTFKLMFKLTVVLFLYTLATGLIAPTWVWGSPEELLDGVAAVVNSSVVTVSEVREAMYNREQATLEDRSGIERRKKLQSLKNLATRELVDRQLILQEFRKREFAIPSGVVEGQIRKIICENFNGDRAALVKTLWSQCCTLNQLEKIEMDRMAVLAMR